MGGEIDKQAGISALGGFRPPEDQHTHLNRGSGKQVRGQGDHRLHTSRLYEVATHNRVITAAKEDAVRDQDDRPTLGREGGQHV